MSISDYQAGDRVEFLKDFWSFGRGSIGEVESVGNDLVHVRHLDGLTVPNFLDMSLRSQALGQFDLGRNIIRKMDLESPLSSLTFEEEMELGKEYLDKIKVLDPNAVIAGGAPRCWKAGKTCNDIDIFLSLPSYMKARDAMDHLETTLGLNLMCKGEHYEEQGPNGIKFCFSFYEETKEIQLICIEGDPSYMLETFPYTHTMIDWDGEEFDTTTQYDLFESWGVITRMYEATPAYTSKAERLAEDNGWQIANNPLEALEIVSQKMRNTG